MEMYQGILELYASKDDLQPHPDPRICAFPTLGILGRSMDTLGCVATNLGASTRTLGAAFGRINNGWPRWVSDGE